MPPQIRYVMPVSARDADGLVADVYAQVAGEFGIARPPALVTLSPAPDVLAATWAMLRESLLVGAAHRRAKEVVSTGVSVANRCPFCVDAHTALPHATGDHGLAETIARGETPADPEHAALLAWSTATRRPGAPELAVPPFPTHLTAEFVGTALAFHFINRTTSALVTDNVLAGNAMRFRPVRWLGGLMFARAVRRQLRPGESLPLLEGSPAGPAPMWAAGSPVGTAFAALRAAAATGGPLLSEAARTTVVDTVAAWDGEHPSLSRGWLTTVLDGLSGEDQAGARLTILAAVAPYRITDADVAAWRADRPDDSALVRLVSFGAFLAVARVEAAICTGTSAAVAAR